MHRKICYGCISLILLLGIGIASIYAYTEVSVKNEFSTGVVDISLKEYMVQNDTEKLWENNIKNILPGQNISKIPRIKNYGNDCYIRADVDFLNIPITKDIFYGISDEWILAPDGYYYYKNILKSGMSVDLFKGFVVPENFDKKYENTRFDLQINVDAIQSDHFKPDFSLFSPWGDVEIQTCKKEGLHEISTFNKKEFFKFKITYKDDTKKLIKNHENFFANFPVLLPGDRYTDSVDIRNNSKEPVKLYFHTSILEENELLDKVMLKIYEDFDNKSRLVYDGTIRGKELFDNTLLADMNGGEEGKVIFEIYVPEELDNDYVLSGSEVVWNFLTEPIKYSEPSVPTGDHTLKTCLILFVIGGIMVISGTIWRFLERASKKNET